MGSRGDCFDNALAESFFATLECELLARQRFPTRNAARLALFDVHRGVLQHAPPAFRARVPIPRGLREEVDPFPAGHLVVRCPSNRGNSSTLRQKRIAVVPYQRHHFRRGPRRSMSVAFSRMYSRGRGVSSTSRYKDVGTQISWQVRRLVSRSVSISSGLCSRMWVQDAVRLLHEHP